MKKILLILLALVISFSMVFSLCSCGSSLFDDRDHERDDNDEEDEEDEEDEDNEKQEPSTKKTTTETTEIKEYTSFLINPQPIKNANIYNVSLNQSNKYVSANFTIYSNSSEELNLSSISIDLYNSEGVLLGSLQSLSINIPAYSSSIQTLTGNINSDDDDIAVDSIKIKAS